MRKEFGTQHTASTSIIVATRWMTPTTIARKNSGDVIFVHPQNIQNKYLLITRGEILCYSGDSRYLVLKEFM